MHLARAVRGDDDDRRLRGFHGPELRDAQLEVGEQLEQEGFERLVRAVDFVEQQHGGPGLVRRERREQRPFDQVLTAVERLIEIADRTFRFREANGEHLPRVVPLVGGSSEIEPFVALQADQLTAERAGQHLRDFRLADAGFAFEQQRPPHAQSEIHDGREAAVRDVVAAAQQCSGFVDVPRQWAYSCRFSHSTPALFPSPSCRTGAVGGCT